MYKQEVFCVAGIPESIGFFGVLAVLAKILQCSGRMEKNLVITPCLSLEFVSFTCQKGIYKIIRLFCPDILKKRGVEV